MGKDTTIGARPLRGMSDAWFAEPQSPELLENVYLDASGAWRTCGGYTQAASFQAGTPNRVHSLHWFSQHSGGRQWLLCEHEDTTSGTLDLAYLNFSNDTLTAIETDRIRVPGPVAGSTYFEQGDWVYILNGYDAPKRWNGFEYVRVGFDVRPPPPSANPSGYDEADANFNASPNDFGGPFQRGLGVEESSSDANASRYLYGYAIQGINDRGMASPASEIVWVNGQNTDYNSGTLRGAGSVTVEIPELPSHYRAVRLLRTVNLYGAGATLGASLYPIADFATGGNVAYADGTPDSDLIVAYDPDDHGLWPFRARYGQIFKNVLFVDDGDRIRYSAPVFIEQMPEQNFLVLGDSTAGPVMGFKSTKNALVVFKRRGIYLIKGNPSDGFWPETLTEDFGVASPRAIVEVPGLGTLFLSDEGPYVLVGALEDTGTPTRIEYIGESLSRTWREEVNTRALASARVGRNLRDREVWFQVPADGDDRPTLGLVYHYALGAWSKRTGYPFGCFAETRDHRGYLYAGSWDTSADAKRGIHVYTRGEVLPGPVAISSTVSSPWLETGERSLPHHLTLQVLNTGRAFTLDWRAERDDVYTGPEDVTVYLRDYERDRDAWGTATWDVASWQSTAPVLLPMPLVLDAAFHFQWRLVGAKVAVLGYEVSYDRDVKVPKLGPSV